MLRTITCVLALAFIAASCDLELPQHRARTAPEPLLAATPPLPPPMVAPDAEPDVDHVAEGHRLMGEGRFAERGKGVFWLSPTPDRPTAAWGARLRRICSWVRLIDRHTQRRDHPVIATLPETHYLKGFTLQTMGGW